VHVNGNATLAVAEKLTSQIILVIVETFPERTWIRDLAITATVAFPFRCTATITGPTTSTSTSTSTLTLRVVENLRSALHARPMGA
jgi:hypothetical protein